MNDPIFQAPEIDEIARLLPQYDFLSFIAQGGMGAVYLAKQRGLDREVALKILPREFGADPAFRASFEAEARAMAKLNHPNLISVYDFGDVDGMPYIVMEYVNGESLYQAAYDCKIDPQQAAVIVRKISDGLAHAHAQGIIHRDIKPANVLLNMSAEPKIGDFGLARPAGKDESGVVMGTPGYVAPEVLNRPDLADKRSDLFAVGVIFYELLTGARPPFASTPPPSTICGCDIALDRICDKAMNNVAALRYQSAEELSADLSAWLAKQGPAAALVPHARKGPPAPRRPTAYVPVKRKGGAGGLLVAAAVIAALGFFAWKKYGRPAEVPVVDAVVEADKPSGGVLEEATAPSAGHGITGGRSQTEEESISAFGSTHPSGRSSGVSRGFSGGGTAGNPSEDTRPAESLPSSPPPSAVVELETKAKQLVSDLEKKRRDLLSESAKSALWDVDLWMRTLPNGRKQEWMDEVESLKSMLVNGRLPADFEDDLEVSEEMKKAGDAAVARQNGIEGNFKNAAEKIRSSYVTRMNDIARKLGAANDAKGARHASARAEKARVLGDWLVAMGSEGLREPEEIRPPKLKRTTPRATEFGSEDDGSGEDEESGDE